MVVNIYWVLHKHSTSYVLSHLIFTASSSSPFLPIVRLKKGRVRWSKVGVSCSMVGLRWNEVGVRWSEVGVRLE